MNKLESSKVWSRHETALKAGPEKDRKEFEALSKTEKEGLAACAWLSEKEGKQYPSALKQVSVGDKLTRTSGTQSSRSCRNLANQSWTSTSSQAAYSGGNARPHGEGADRSPLPGRNGQVGRSTSQRKGTWTSFWSSAKITITPWKWKATQKPLCFAFKLHGIHWFSSVLPGLWSDFF